MKKSKATYKLLKELLKKASSYLCEDGKIEFAVCDAGTCNDAGNSLRDQLDKDVGSNYIIHAGQVRISNRIGSSPRVVPSSSPKPPGNPR